MSKQHCALVMAGGTGGHIFPGLAVAEALRERGWRVHWLGGRSESDPAWKASWCRRAAFPSSHRFSGVRGKGPATLAFLPLRLLKAFWQSIQVVRRVKPDVVVGLGGYISFPAGMMSVLLGKPLVLHEQNSVAGMVNKVLAGVADRVFTAFPMCSRKAEWIGNPLRPASSRQPGPVERFAGPHRPAEVAGGGRQPGRRGLNELVPKALALMPEAERPQVTAPERRPADRRAARQLRRAGVRPNSRPLLKTPRRPLPMPT
jgi:UDP-N-acetylglucosamine--N-acetylmuramyl-(pentapeptide) pyrophosphoryl-undecaprenol N-acetylglucosamine transferase